eukprot:6214769-Pleurochrysis_carterae.AAC.2
MQSATFSTRLHAVSSNTTGKDCCAPRDACVGNYTAPDHTGRQVLMSATSNSTCTGRSSWAIFVQTVRLQSRQVHRGQTTLSSKANHSAIRSITHEWWRSDAAAQAGRSGLVPRRSLALVPCAPSTRCRMSECYERCRRMSPERRRCCQAEAPAGDSEGIDSHSVGQDALDASSGHQRSPQSAYVAADPTGPA